MSEQSTQDSQDLSFFKGQMAARYRERLSMGFGASTRYPASDISPTGAIPSTGPQWSSSKTGSAKPENESEDKWSNYSQPLPGEIKIPTLPTTRSRSLSGEQGNDGNKPAMRDLISKFERRSFTATHLKQAKEDVGQIRFAREAWRGNSTGIKMELDPAALTSSSPSDDQEISLSNSSESKPPCAKVSRATLTLNNEPQGLNVQSSVCANLSYDKEISDVQAGVSDACLGHTQDLGNSVTPSPVLNWKKDCIDLENRGFNLSQNGSQTHDPGAKDPEPIQVPMSTEAAPLRVNLREYANQSKATKANNAKYVVHKKEWGKRFQNRPETPENTSPVPKLDPVPQEPRPRSRDEKESAAVTTPSNTQQRLEKRSWHRQLEAKDETEPKPEEKKESAMDRYLKFLKRSSTALPPTPTNTPSEGLKQLEREKTEAQKAVKPPAFHRPQFQKKTKEGLTKKLKTNASKESQVGRKQSFGQSTRQALIRKQNLDKDARTDILSRFRPEPKILTRKQGKALGTDRSAGDTGVNIAFTPSVSATSSVYDNSNKVPGRTEQNQPDVLNTKLPRVALQKKTKPMTSNVSVTTSVANKQSHNEINQDQRMPNQKESKQDSKEIKSTLSMNMKTSFSHSSVPRVQDNSKFNFATKAGLPRTDRSTSPCGLETQQQRSIASYRRFGMANGSTVKSLKQTRCKSNPPENTLETTMPRHTFPPDPQDMHSVNMTMETSNMAGHLLTEDELADNDLIPSHLRDRQSHIMKDDVFPINSSSDDSCGVQIHSSIKKLKTRRILSRFDEDNEEPISTADTEFLRKTLDLVTKADSKLNTSTCLTSEADKILCESKGDLGSDHPATSIKGESVNFDKLIQSLAEELNDTDPFVSRHAPQANKPEVSKVRKASSPIATAWSTDSKECNHSNQFSSTNPEEFASAISLKDELNMALDQNPSNPKVIQATPREESNRQSARLWSPLGRGWAARNPSLDSTKRNYAFINTQETINSVMGFDRDTQRQKETPHTGAGDLDDRDITPVMNITYRKESHQKPSQPVSAYHFGDTEHRIEENVDAVGKIEKAASANSPQKKKRKLEKSKKLKKKKKKKREDADDDTDVTQSQPLTKPGKEKKSKGDKSKERQHTPKERRRTPSLGDGVKNLPPILGSEHASEKPKTRETSPRLDEAKLQQLAVRRYYEDTPSLTHSPELSTAWGNKRNVSKSRERPSSIPSVGKNDTPMETSPFIDWTSLWKERTTSIKALEPVRRLDSGPTKRWPIKSHIPTITDKTHPVVPGDPQKKINSPRKRINILVQYRRLREAMLDSEHPCRIPLSEAFRRTLDMAVVEEWALHCWEPTNLYLGSPDASWWSVQSGNVSDGCYTPIPGHGKLLSKEGLLELSVRLPYMKVGPLRLLHASYLMMGVICLLAGLVMVKLYQCGGDEYEYFCPEDDLECLMQLFPAAV